MNPIDQEMVEYWDRVSEAVLSAAATYNVTPLYIIEEFCIDGDLPTPLSEA